MNTNMEKIVVPDDLQTLLDRAVEDLADMNPERAMRQVVLMRYYLLGYKNGKSYIGTREELEHQLEAIHEELDAFIEYININNDYSGDQRKEE